VADDMAEGARRNPVASARAAAALCRGLADDDLELLLAAVDLYRSSPRRLDTARAEGLTAVALRSAGRPGEAAPLVDSALATYRELGANGSAIRLRRAVGRRSRSRSGRPSFGWDSLTATERLVVDLLRDGLTNREIGDRLGISRRTVETHLSHTFSKVGVATRVQLAVAASAAPTSPGTGS
jgi:DNA-binding NarL/FixJ family response regulator